MFIVVRKSDSIHKKKFQNDLSIDSVLSSSLNNLSLDVFEEIDYNERGKALFNRIYQIYEGNLHVIINDEEIILRKGDSIFIGKGTSYEMKGTFKAVAINKVLY